MLEPAERRAVTLVQQLNALRNERTIKRRAKQARQREVQVPPLRWSGSTAVLHGGLIGRSWWLVSNFLGFQASGMGFVL